jgi:predicted nucleic acid-binding protein
MSKPDGLILVDTSAWILGLKQSCPEILKKILTEILDKDHVCICGIILLEILQGTRTKKEYYAIYSDLKALHYFEVNQEIWIRASQLGYDLRRKGKTIPSADLLIASIAIYYNLYLLHADQHFEIIKQISDLKTRSVN